MKRISIHLSDFTIITPTGFGEPMTHTKWWQDVIRGDFPVVVSKDESLVVINPKSICRVEIKEAPDGN